MRVEVRGEAKQIGGFFEFRIEQRVMMSANVIGNMTVQDVGEDKGGRAISWDC